MKGWQYGGCRQRAARAFFLIAVACLACSPALAKTLGASNKKTAPKNLSKAIQQLLSSPEANAGFWGIQVSSLSDGKTIYSLNADKLFTPASNMKLVTTASAFALIGRDYRYSTTVEAAAMPDAQGRITGDLDLIGRGDSNLSGRVLPFNVETLRTNSPTQALENFGDQLVKEGVKSVAGDVVGDDTFLPDDRYGEGWALDDVQWYYGTPVSALSLNDNMIQVTITPGPVAGTAVQIAYSPFAGYYAVDNRLTTSAPGTKKDITILREPGSRVLQLWGSIAAGAQPEINDLAVEDPAEFAAFCFKRVLEGRGIQVAGRAVAQHRQLSSLEAAAISQNPPAVTQAPKGVVLASRDSLPLGEDLRVINKVSQNLHAELLLRMVGKLRGGSGTAESGVQAETEFLNQAGVMPEEYHILDGSGLSREDLITPAALVKLLVYARQQSWGAEFESTLPVAAADGSLLDRFIGSIASGRVRAKTGSIEHVNALSGYLVTLSGDNVAFSIMVNNHHMHEREATGIIDQIVEAIVRSRAQSKHK